VFSAFLLANKPVEPSDSGPLARPIDMTDTVQLGWDNRVISIEFAALSFRAPEFSRYRYMLDGFDTQWSEVDSTRRLVTYTNLDPGWYVFRVTGSNASGVWNPTGRALTLIISPPWWGTWWFRIFGTAIIAGGLLVAYLWRVRSLKAQQRLLEAVVAQRTQALEEALGTQQAALDTRDEFLRALAHDLKAPLSNLSWHVQMLNRRARDGRLEPDALDKGLEAISIGSAEAVAAIDELHDLTRLAASSPLPLQLEPVDLVALVRQLVAARLETSRHDVEFVSDYETLTGHVDRARLARIFDNLLDNATKYSPAGGQIRVSVDREVVDGAESAVLRVQDYGLGIPLEDLPHVFERYRRGSNVAQIPGDGLGLASVRQLVELHGGQIGVESREGRGSTFTIRLPLSHAPAPV